MTKEINERELVLEILLAVTRDGKYSHLVIRDVLSKYQYLEKKERAFITRVAEGTLEHMIELDYILNQYSKVKTNKMKPVIRNILRSALYQILYMDTVPDSAACNEAVKLAAKKGFQTLKGFVNGVLRSCIRGKDSLSYPPMDDTSLYLSVRYSMPEWIVERWLQDYGKELTEVMLADFMQEKPTTIRRNPSVMTEEELLESLADCHVTVSKHPYLSYAYEISGYDYLADLPAFIQGGFYVQDISSMLVSAIANPQKGDKVIDVCAAPGGKSMHMAELLEGTGSVEARDLTEYKVGLIEENILRCGLTNIRARQWDATVSDEASIETADIVIADLPCSGLGVLGKKTDLKHKVTKEQVRDLVNLQRQMLSVVSRYVRPGGTLIYSTCTVMKDENVENVRWFLSEHPEFKLTSIRDRLCEELQDSVSEEGMLQFLPGVHRSDGFFIAKLRKE